MTLQQLRYVAMVAEKGTMTEVRQYNRGCGTIIYITAKSHQINSRAGKRAGNCNF